MLDNLDFPTQRLLDPGDEAAFILATISPEVLEARKMALQWSQHQAATGVILDVGFMHDTISFSV
jgi:hypothetical protein